MRSHLPTIIIISLVIVFGVWQIILLIMNEHPITNFPPHGSHVIALGDSLTVGVGATSPERSFVSLLENRTHITITNKGVSGDTTRDAKLRLTQDVLDEKADIVVVLLGGNDYLGRIPEQETFDNLRFIILEIQKHGGIVILLGIRGGLIADHFDDNFLQLARETGSLYVPNVLEGILGDPTLMSDAIHPNDRGYEKMADKIAPALLGLIAGVTP